MQRKKSGWVCLSICLEIDFRLGDFFFTRRPHKQPNCHTNMENTTPLLLVACAACVLVITRTAGIISTVISVYFLYGDF